MGVELFRSDAWSVRVVEQDGEPWFVAADVLAVLDLDRTSLRRLDDDEKGVDSIHTPGGEQQVTIVNEPGLYSLILGSRKPEAKAFKRWITHDVLPAIRRSGTYQVAPQFALPQTYAEALRALANESEARQALEVKVAEIEPSADAWDNLIDGRGDVSVADAAKILSTEHGIKIGRDRLFGWMLDNKWIFRGGDGHLHAYQTQVDAGRLAEKPQSHWDQKQCRRVVDNPQVRVTMKGIAALYKALAPDFGSGLALVKGGVA